MDAHQPRPGRGAHGYSLVSLLMMVVILGALTAAAIVGVSSMTGGSSGTGVISNVTSSTRAAVRVTNTTGRGGTAGIGVGSGGGVSALSACKVSAAAAGSASTLYFAGSGGAYPVKWSDMTGAKPPLFTLATNVIVNPANPAELEGRGWKMVMAGGGTRAPTFTCSS
jgi:hypothetical protein